MEVMITVLSCLVGVCIAIISGDFLTRRSAIKELRDTKRQFDDTMAKINTVHNELAEKVLDMRDKVAAHEFQLTARQPKMRTTKP